MQVKIWFQNKRSKFKKIYKTQGPGAQLAVDAELSGEMQSNLALMVNGPESPASPASTAEHSLDTQHPPPSTSSTGLPATPTSDIHSTATTSGGSSSNNSRPNPQMMHQHNSLDRPHSHQSPAINPDHLQQTLKCEMMNSPSDMMSQQRELTTSPREMMTSPPMPSPKDMMQGNLTPHGGSFPGGPMDPRRMAMDATGHMAAAAGYPLGHPHAGHPGHPQWDPASTYMYWNHYGDVAAAHQINQQIMT